MITNKNWTEADVVCHFIGDRSFQDSADWLNAGIPEAYQVTRATIHNWVVGRNEPSWLNLMAYVLIYPFDDERHKMARQIIDMRNRKILETLRETA